MALLDIITKASTDRSAVVRIIDSTDGTPETAVVYNTAGIDLWYRREGAAKVSITEVTLAALTTAHADGGFLAISDGEYRLDLPDAAFATGANYVDIGGTVTDMVVIGGRIRLVDIDLETAAMVSNVTEVNGVAVSVATEFDANLTKFKGSVPADMDDTDKIQVSVAYKLATLDLTDVEKKTLLELLSGGIK